MKSNFLKLLPIFILLLFASCKKEAGVGGTSSVNGRIHANYYDKYFYTLADSAYAADVDVYIIYGNELSFGERQRTSFDGRYEFKYLRNGTYKIYAYSRDSTGAYKNKANQYSPDIAIIEEVQITKGNQSIELPTIQVLK